LFIYLALWTLKIDNEIDELNHNLIKKAILGSDVNKETRRSRDYQNMIIKKQNDMEDHHMNIIVIDDEEDLCEILQFNLESQGYNVSVAYSAEEALRKDLSKFDLILLDVMMGGISGYKLTEKIRKDLKLSTPIIFLTARSTENDLLTGFNLGADDYITKPFSINEVSARVKAVLSRSSPENSTHTIDFGDIKLNLDNKTLAISGETIDLPRKEFEIFSLLLKNPNRIFTREEILYRAWPDEVIVNERTVDVNITRLRKKVQIFGVKILSKPGYGYYFQPKEEN